MDRSRRALEHQGGPVELRGDPEVAAVLGRAFEATRDATRDPLTHGLHAYPARTHHAIARTVLEAWAEPRMRVLDPFCGSGTVLVEARRLDLRGCGVDLNPLGLEIAEIACARLSEAQRRNFEEMAARVVEASFQRVSERVRVRAPLPAEERRWYQPHVLHELAGLHAEIEALPQGPDRRALLVVFSSIVVKFSKQRSETAEREIDKRIGKKVVTGFFARKAEELSRRWEAYAEQVPKDSPRPKLCEGDALRLRQVLGNWQFDLVLSSPPYGGTYDYADHHARRWPWLGLSGQGLQKGELGARRRLSQGNDKGHEAVRRWEQEVQSMLRSISDVLAPRARVVLLVGDAQVGGTRVVADQQLEKLAGRAGLVLEAVASQGRLDWKGGVPRREHLVALRLVDR